MTFPRYIDDDMSEPGQPLFLVLACPQGRADVWSLRDRPLHTNGSHEPRLGSAEEHEWCGTTDNVARYACGLARVTKIHSNGRARIERVPEAQISAALETLGYPELG